MSNIDIPRERLSSALQYRKAISLGDTQHPEFARAILNAVRADPSFDIPKVVAIQTLGTDHIANMKATDLSVLFDPPSPPPAGSDDTYAAIMAEVRGLLAKIGIDDLAPGTLDNAHWRQQRVTLRGLIESFHDPRSIVLLAQSRFSGFDHRALQQANASIVVDKKLEIMAESFGIYPLLLDEIRESPLSFADSVVTRSGRPLSSSVLWHAHMFLSVSKSLPKTAWRDILEIGGGYGGLARLFLRSSAVNSYTILDLPESLACSYAYLRLSFPELSIQFVTDEASRRRMDEHAINLVPTTNAGALFERQYGLAVNTGSFREMPRSTCLQMMAHLQKNVSVGHFYSLNYGFERSFSHRETLQQVDDEVNLIAPELDGNWSLVDFRVNPLDIVLDSPRNWIEVLLRRDDGNTGPMPIPEDTNAHAWFGAVWMNLWKAPTPELIDLYMDGIARMCAGKTDVPYLSDLWEAGKFDEEFAKVGEVIYWKCRLAELTGGSA